MTDQLENQQSTPNDTAPTITHSFEGVCAVSKISADKVKVIDKTSNFTFYYSLLKFIDIITIMFDAEKARKVSQLLGEQQTLIVDFQQKRLMRVKAKPQDILALFLSTELSMDKIEEYLGTNPAPSFKGVTAWQK